MDKENFDIIQFAKNIISEVDSIRSYEKVTGTISGENIQKPVESRLSAFFRLVGLPSLVNIEPLEKTKKSTGYVRFLTPGYDIYMNSKFSKYNITPNDPIVEIREGKLLDIENLIGTEIMNNNMTTAFIAPLPLIPNFPPLNGSSNIKAILDEEGDEHLRIGYKQLTPTRPLYKKVVPLYNQLARPFLPDSKRSTIDRQVLKKPFIETIIRIRFVFMEAKANPTQEDYTKTELYKYDPDATIFSGSPSVLESFIFDKFYKSLDQLAVVWDKLNRETESIIRDNKYYKINVKTSSAKDNMLGKRIVKTELDLNTTNGSKKLEEMRLLKIKIAKNDALLTLLPTEENENNIATSSNALNSTFVNLISSEINKYKKELTNIESAIEKDSSKIESLRVQKEILTGEFTGLSLLDVVSVIIGLFSIGRDELISLLDKETKELLAEDKVLKSVLKQYNNNITDQEDLEKTKNALKSLEDKINAVFDYVNMRVKQIKNIRNNNKNKNSGNK